MKGNKSHEALAAHAKVEFLPIAITTKGYVYIWVSNESEATKVWFDDLSVTHNLDIVTQATDYGPWGDVVREQKTNELDIYRYGYQGKYAEKDEETGWSHFEFREYDPIIGKWLSPDRKRQYWSPYMAMGNNPVSRVDPSGGEDSECPECGNVQILNTVNVTAPRWTAQEESIFQRNFVDLTGLPPLPQDATRLVLNSHYPFPSYKPPYEEPDHAISLEFDSGGKFESGNLIGKRTIIDRIVDGLADIFDGFKEKAPSGSDIIEVMKDKNNSVHNSPDSSTIVPKTTQPQTRYWKKPDNSYDSSFIWQGDSLVVPNKDKPRKN